MENCFHRAPEDGRQAIRLRAVEAVLRGERRGAVARRHGVSRQSLHVWLGRHRLTGPAGLAARSGGRTGRPLLGPAEEAAVIETIAALPPWRAGLSCTCWTRNAVAALVERRHGLRASHWQVDRMLRRWGFRDHKEVRRAYRGRPDSVDTLLAAARDAGRGSSPIASPRGA